MSIRAIVNRITGFTLNILLLDREVCIPEDNLFGLSTVNTQRQIPSYLSELIEKLWVVFLAAYENLRMAQCRQKKDYDTRAPKRERKFYVGD